MPSDFNLPCKIKILRAHSPVIFKDQNTKKNRRPDRPSKIQKTFHKIFWNKPNTLFNGNEKELSESWDVVLVLLKTLNDTPYNLKWEHMMSFLSATVKMVFALKYVTILPPSLYIVSVSFELCVWCVCGVVYYNVVWCLIEVEFKNNHIILIWICCDHQSTTLGSVNARGRGTHPIHTTTRPTRSQYLSHHNSNVCTVSR